MMTFKNTERNIGHGGPFIIAFQVVGVDAAA